MEMFKQYHIWLLLTFQLQYLRAHAARNGYFIQLLFDLKGPKEKKSC